MHHEGGIFARDLIRDARRITNAELRSLLQPDRAMADWRSRIVAAFLIAIDRRTEFREAIGTLLLTGRASDAGTGYCFAAAAFGTPSILTAYLDRFLPQPQVRDAQPWALGALLHLDRRSGTGHAQPYLTSGAWHRWREAVPSHPDVESYAEAMGHLCAIGFASPAQPRSAMIWSSPPEHPSAAG
ncbi:hypothetical protein Ade02nite_63390 [Paractinoplanes deccanensis]|uniref:Uncharacterized protein n=1 Tax=Paractinoplanes deccanensis TaxID=113561 RepID=A0ABQ3YCJ1_9ACTN|nr:DUF6000 family protein [Actinoplanes deccanensis]GID77698.1 hypothetical protein Ade02nite_63390 [Actinoplanes deccanensis]